MKDFLGDSQTDWSALGSWLRHPEEVIDIDGSFNHDGRVLVIEAKPFDPKRGAFRWSNGSDGRRSNAGQWGHLKAHAEYRNKYGHPMQVLVVYLEDRHWVESIRAWQSIRETDDYDEWRVRVPAACDFEMLGRWFFTLWHGGAARMCQFPRACECVLC